MKKGFSLDQLEGFKLDLEDEQVKLSRTAASKTNLAMMAGAIKPELYSQVDSELKVSNDSDTVNNHIQILKENNLDSLQEATYEALSSSSDVELSTEIAMDYGELKGAPKSSIESLQEEFLSENAADVSWLSFQNKQRAKSSLKESLQNLAADANKGAMAAELVTTMVLPAVEQALAAYIELPKDVSLSDFILSGEGKVKLGEVVNNMPEEQYVEFMKSLEQVSEDIYENTGMTLTPMIFFEDSFDPVYKDSWWKTLDNIVSLADYVAIGVGARSLVKGARASKLSKGSDTFRLTGPERVSEASDDFVGPTVPREVVEGSEDFVGPVRSPAINPNVDPQSFINVAKLASQDYIGGILNVASTSDAAALKISGLTRAELTAAEILPRFYQNGFDLSDVTPIPNQLESANITRAKALQDEILGNLTMNGYQVTEAEKLRQMKADAEWDVKGLNRMDGATKVTPLPDGSGYVTASVFSRAGKSPTWSSVSELVEDVTEATSNLGITEKDLIVLRKSPDGSYSALTPAEANALITFDFEKEVKALGDRPSGGASRKVKVEYKNKLKELKAKAKENPEEQFQVMVVQKKTWTNRDVDGFTDSKVTGSKYGKVTDYILNPVNRISKEITNLVRVYNDRSVGISAKMLDIVKPFTELSNKSKLRVNGLLEKGDAISHRYTDDELYYMVKSGDLSQQEAEAVKSAYIFFDTKFIVDNRHIAKTLADGQYRMIKWGEGEGATQLIGKPIGETRIANGDLDIYSIGTERRLGMQDLSKSQYHVLEVKDPITLNDGKIARYIAVPKETTEFYRPIREFDVVLDYRDGYYPRRYRGDYFVDRVLKKDGKVIRRNSVGNFESIAKAEKFSKKKLETNTYDAGEDITVEYEVRQSQELQEATDLFSTGDDKLITNSLGDLERGRSIQRHRGKRLEAFDDSEAMQVAKVEDPLETMTQAAFTTGRLGVHYESIGVLESRFVNSFKHLLPDGQFPRKLDDIQPLGSAEEVNNAKALYKYITEQKNSADLHMIKKLSKRLLYSFGELLDKSENAKLSQLAKLSRWGGDKDPVQLVKSMAFLDYIVGSPVRQRILQTAQLTVLTPLTTKFLNPVKLLSYQSALQKAILAQIDSKSYNKVLDSLGKHYSDFSREEWDALVSGLDRSGMLKSVDVNQLVEGLTRNIGIELHTSKAMLAADKAIDTVKQPLRFAKKHGFDAGELANLTGTFLVAAERYKQQNKIESLADITKAQWHDIASSTRNLSWNMNNTDRFAYQKGLLSALFQFVQVFHKGFLFGALGNRELSKAERAKVIATQAVVYTGLYKSIVDPIVDTLVNDPISEDQSPEAERMKKIMTDGLVESLSNAVLTAAYQGITGSDDEVDINFGATSAYQDLLGVYGGVISPWFEGDLLPNINDLPGVNATKGTFSAIADAWAIAAGNISPEKPLPERLPVAALALSQMFSSAKHATKAYIGSQLEKQALVNSRFLPDLDANVVELFVYGATGINTNDSAELNKFRNNFYSGSDYNPPDYKEIADTVWKRLVLSYGSPETEKFQEAWTHLYYSMEVEDRERVQKELYKLNKRATERGEDVTFETIYKRRRTMPLEKLEIAFDYYSENSNDEDALRVLEETLDFRKDN